MHHPILLIAWRAIAYRHLGATMKMPGDDAHQHRGDSIIPDSDDGTLLPYAPPNICQREVTPAFGVRRVSGVKLAVSPGLRAQTPFGEQARNRERSGQPHEPPIKFAHINVKG
jgi:hypothetical protein